MAEALARKLLADRLQVKESELQEKGYRVISAGTSAGYGGAAAEEAEQVVKKFGADLSGHESRPVTVAMIEEAGIAAIRAKSVALTSYAITVADEWLAPLGVTLASPTESEERGGAYAGEHAGGRARPVAGAGARRSRGNPRGLAAGSAESAPGGAPDVAAAATRRPQSAMLRR